MKSGQKGYEFTQEQMEEVIALQSEIKEARLYRKLDVLRLRMSGYNNAEIARITGYSASRVSALVCICAKEGLDYFRQENRKSGNRRNLSLEEEAEMLSGFLDKAKQGILVSVQEIKDEYETRCGRQTATGTIYKVLERHHWRKVVPRSRHPKKASDEVVEASKKLISA